MARQQRQRQPATTASIQKMGGTRKATATNQWQQELRKCLEYVDNECKQAETMADATLRSLMRDTEQFVKKDAAQLESKLDQLAAAHAQLNKEGAELQALYNNVPAQIQNIVTAWEADTAKFLASMQTNIEAVSQRAVAAADSVAERFG